MDMLILPLMIILWGLVALVLIKLLAAFVCVVFITRVRKDCNKGRIHWKRNHKKGVGYGHERDCRICRRNADEAL